VPGTGNVEEIMRLLKIKDAKVGMVVKLTHPLRGYVIGSGNPAVGSDWETTGKITRVKREELIEVQWDNKRMNSYQSETLSVIDDLEQGNCNSIWDD